MLTDQTIPPTALNTISDVNFIVSTFPKKGSTQTKINSGKGLWIPQT